jgi:hypothetical protein
MLETSNPVYQRVLRSSGSLWRLTARLLIVIGGLYIAINLLIAVGTFLNVITTVNSSSGVIGWALLLLIPLPLAIFTTLQTSRDIRSDDYTLVTITKLTPTEMVQGYYEGARKRFRVLVVVLVTAAVISAVVPMLFMALAHIAPVRIIPGIYLPFMILYIYQMNRIGPATGIWAALRFRDPSAALGVTAAIIGGITLSFIILYLIVIANAVLLVGMFPMCIRGAIVMPIPLSAVTPHRLILKRAEQFV